MLDLLSIVGLFAFSSLAYAFWYAGHDQISPADAEAAAGKTLVS